MERLTEHEQWVLVTTEDNFIEMVKYFKKNCLSPFLMDWEGEGFYLWNERRITWQKEKGKEA